MPDIKKPKYKIADIEAIEKTAKVFEAMYFSRLMSLSDIVNRYVNITLKNEVNWLRLRTLIIIVGLGKGKISPSELAENLMRPNQNVTKIVHDLERDNLLVKMKEPGDQRVLTIRITNMGLEYILSCMKKITFAENELENCLDKKELQMLANIGNKIRNRLVPSKQKVWTYDIKKGERGAQ